ncbi:ExbD/TolR family protein [Acinetobacter rathckeae]|uniref:ExbD/TolR family protein n=1 Tax=Acinetobacter rathckeae TaxID=2605272 RepID=UPI0018A321A8|nr:biopolymer transporter ExbD [Acinetobacter rathckeae]MBF7687228.1 biopolymer transporter ExbD [Acinetobacter rathckeae]MBF7694419.1 biopolymer transporter ExbD [Acinetobacter rathckeae]
MGMNVGSEGDDDDVIGVINTTPLVDVMLVLLIIFLITVPVVTHTIPVKLPEEVDQKYAAKADNITLAVNKEGQVFWNEQYVPNQETLLSKLKENSVKRPQPEVHIRGDQQTHFESIGKVIETVQQAGIIKISFVTQPPARG